MHAQPRPAPLFVAAWSSLAVRLARPGPALTGLIAASRARCTPPAEGRDWSPCHRAFWGLVDGGPQGLAAAKAAFWQEWRDGAALADAGRGGNGIHAWNSLEFRLGHRWICAAMLAQLLILFDRLAAAGAFSKSEIDTIGNEALATMEAHIAPHQRGRGHQPILHEPINQAAAMAAGQLYAGHLFGGKWRHWPRARELYASARQLVADNLGQHERHGYDSDGFTYLRLILPACHTLSVALLEEVEGGDWYHREFAPNGTSLALINRRLQGMVGWSGLSWPLGRYGYIQPWNGFAAAFASRRSGDPTFVGAMLRDNAEHAWDSPWLGLELPLTLLWWPDGDDPVKPAVRPLDELVPAAWWSGTVAGAGVHTLSTWLRGKAPHWTLEVAGEPVVLGGLETWTTSNAVQPEGFGWGHEGWYVAGGRLLAGPRLPRLSGAVVDTAGSYPPAAGVAEARRSSLLIDGRLLLVAERWRGTHAGRWQALVRADIAIAGAVASSRQLQLGADRPWGRAAGRSITLGPDKIDTCQLVLAGTADDRFAVAATWDGSLVVPEWQDGDVVRLGDTQVLLPGAGRRSIAGWSTDAALAVRHADGAWSLAGVRRLDGPDGTRLWCSDPVDVTLDADGLRVHGLPYGGFATLRAPDRWLCLRRGNGLIAWARCGRTQTLAWDGETAAGVMLNGSSVEAGTELRIAAWHEPTDDLAILEQGDYAVRIAVLGRIRRAQDIRALPALRRLLAADPAEPHLDGRPRLSEATHLRAETAATCAALGAEALTDALIGLLRLEAERDYAPGEDAWSRGFWGSTARAVVLDALLLLDGRAVLPLLPELRRGEVVPHAQEAIARVQRLLG